MNDTHEVRELARRLKLANKTIGSQGAVIAALRGELARVREDHDKIERGELRRLQRFEQRALQQFALHQAQLTNLRAQLLRQRVSAD